jgi:hypothetical protein
MICEKILHQRTFLDEMPGNLKTTVTSRIALLFQQVKNLRIWKNAQIPK